MRHIYTFVLKYIHPYIHADIHADTHRHTDRQRQTQTDIHADIHDMTYMTWHGILMTCLCHIHDMFMTCSWHFPDIFMIYSWHDMTWHDITLHYTAEAGVPRKFMKCFELEWNWGAHEAHNSNVPQEFRLKLVRFWGHGPESWRKRKRALERNSNSCMSKKLMGGWLWGICRQSSKA